MVGARSCGLLPMLTAWGRMSAQPCSCAPACCWRTLVATPRLPARLPGARQPQHHGPRGLDRRVAGVEHYLLPRGSGWCLLSADDGLRAAL